MKIKLNEPILNYQGDPIRDGLDNNTIQVCAKAVQEAGDKVLGEGNAGRLITEFQKSMLPEEATYGSIFRQVCEAGFKDKKGRTYEVFEVGLKCVGDTVDLSFDERELLIKLVEESNYTNIVIGRVGKLLKADEIEEKK